MEKLIARLDQAKDYATDIKYIGDQIKTWESAQMINPNTRREKIEELKDERAIIKANLSVVLNQIGEMR